MKFRAEPAALANIAAAYKPLEAISMETAYYDTPTGALRQRKWMLRCRRENGKSICTLKIPLPDGSRGEWETEEDDLSRAIRELIRLGCPGQLREMAAEGLTQQCAARFTRLVKKLTAGAGMVELALDQGQLLAGRRWMPLSEVEVELKAGTEEDCVAFARDLAARFRLEPETRSKAQRAFALMEQKE